MWKKSSEENRFGVAQSVLGLVLGCIIWEVCMVEHVDLGKRKEDSLEQLGGFPINADKMKIIL